MCLILVIKGITVYKGTNSIYLTSLVYHVKATWVQYALMTVKCYYKERLKSVVMT